MLYVFPIGVVVGAPFLPLAVLLYWVANNLWTLGQQYVVYRKIDSEESAKKDAAVATQQARAPRPGQKPVRPETVEPVADADGTPAPPTKTPGAKPVTRKPRPAGGASTGAATSAKGTANATGSANGAAKNVTPNSTNGARGSTSSRPPARRGRKRR
jgi:YidC/Oxa1 family membrane protein insertase